MKQMTPSLAVSKQQAARAAKPWFNGLARLGFGAKGIVYLIVGILAMQTAIGRGGATTDTRGALHTIVGKPFGATLLMIVAIGLVGYALWRFVEAWADTNDKGTSAGGLAARAVYGISGLCYLALALSAFTLVQGRNDGGSTSEMEQAWTARLLAVPPGRLLVGLVGAGILLGFVYQIYRASQGKVPEHLQVGSVGWLDAQTVNRLGRLGLAAKGVVFGLTGLFLIQAALRYDPGQAGGLDRALQTVAQQPYGQLLLGIVALGLIAYGLYLLLIAWSYRNVIK